MKKKAGFTLIELLAVIIILAIIALIATPLIINVVEDMKTQGFKQTALGYYKAAEYVYDEMIMDGKTENIQFTFEDGKQISSNSNYKLEVKGEMPQGGLVYLTKEGHIAVSINNNKYCVYVDGNREVTIHEDINHCGYTPVPEECYVIEHRQLNTNNELDNSEEWMTKEYNILKYKYGSSCPKEFNILLIPSEIDGQKVEGIGKFGTAVSFNISAEHVIIPSGVEVIDYQAFNTSGSRKKINYVTLPEGLIYIGASAFGGKNLTNIDIPDSVVAIGKSAFKNNNISSITIPQRLESIGASAFEGNMLETLEIPNSITYIGKSAFSGSKFKEVIIGDVNMTINSDMFLGSEIDKLIIGQGGMGNITIGDYAFHKAVSEIDGYRQDYGFKELILGNSVKKIDDHAFDGNQLTSVAIPNSVTSIGGTAFSNNKLTSLTIPASVTTIGVSAFGDNLFPNRAAITIEGDSTRFDSDWTNIGFPAK